jgi:hypothetical protein
MNGINYFTKRRFNFINGFLKIKQNFYYQYRYIKNQICIAKRIGSIDNLQLKYLI